MRPISDNVKEVLSEVVYTYNETVSFDPMECKVKRTDLATNLIQAYLTECWVVFNAEDESTHPKDTGIRIVRDDNYFPDVAKFEDGKWYDHYGNIVFDDEVIAYLEIADILP